MASKIPEMARVFVRTRDFHRCVRCKSPAVKGDWHHRRSRSVVDEHQHCPCNGINLCRTCHDWIHQHPFEARQQGWIVSRHASPPDEPVFAEQHGWVLLTCDGEVTPAADPSTSWK